jgi:DNA-nicking Smr family endonuclease
MIDDSFKKLMLETGVKQTNRDTRVRPSKKMSSEATETARARAEDAVTTAASHGLSIEEPAPMDKNKPLEYVAYGADRRVLSLLDEAPFPAQYEVDLHGHTVDEAANAIAALFQIMNERRLTHIRIIHGVGWHSKHGRPLLKAYINRWLKGNPDIVAFASARRSDGGVGVVNAVTSGLFNDRWGRT